MKHSLPQFFDPSKNWGFSLKYGDEAATHNIHTARTKGGTPISIKALESTSILIAPTEDVKNLLKVNLTFNKLMKEYIIDNILELEKLHLLFLPNIAKKRYRFILEKIQT
ncbi:MAG: hypothetical protein AB8H03_06135 [Saprospiraceae bacterium]